jgi:hypothetical protein
LSFWFGVELAIDFGLPLVMAVVGVWLVWRGWPRGKRKGVRVCRACGYDLRETSGEKCPECGFAVNASRGAVFKLLSKRRLALAAVLCVPMMWVLWMGVTFFLWAGLYQYRISQLLGEQPSGASVVIQWPFAQQTQVTDQLYIPYVLCRMWQDRQGAWEAARLMMEPRNVTLTPRGGYFARSQEWLMFLVNGLVYPQAHYERYFPTYQEQMHLVTVNHATAQDHRLYGLMGQVGPISNLEIIGSQIDGKTLEEISKLKSLTQLVIQEVNAPIPDLLRLKELQNLDILMIDFGRPIGPHDIAVLDSLPRVTTLWLKAERVESGCDEALAKLISKPQLWRIHLEMELKEKDFPKTLDVKKGRFGEAYGERR